MCSRLFIASSLPLVWHLVKIVGKQIGFPYVTTRRVNFGHQLEGVGESFINNEALCRDK